jgi:hypothetical protein
MNNTPTPETDASCGYALSSHYGRLEGSYLQMDHSGPFVHAEVARKLERERDEAREDLEFWRGLYKVQEEYLETARRERDEARDTNKKLREVLEWIAERYDDSKPMHQVAMDAYEMSCAARAILQKE